MKHKPKLAIALLGGLLTGAAALHAREPKKPAYIIADVEISDPDAYKAYAAKVPETLKPYHGRIVVRAKPFPKEGAAPRGIVVMLEFDSLADAEKWYGTPPYSELIPERQKAAKAQIYIVEGLPR